MAFTKDKFTLFFSMPLDAQDWANLNASGVKRVMLPFEMATADQIGMFAEAGKRTILRLNEHEYYDDAMPTTIAARLAWYRSMFGDSIEALVCGVEPEHETDLSYDAPTWHQERAREHAHRVDRVRAEVQPLGIKVVSPGWTMRGISETDTLQPGEMAWRELCAPTYHQCDGCGFHLYTYNWLSVVDSLRVYFALQKACVFWHKPIWLIEVGVGSSGPVERMQAYLDIANILLDPALPFSKRVEMFCPFVSNGTGEAWDRGYLLKDPACYDLLSHWMRQ
jgi:hypothetical protein